MVLIISMKRSIYLKIVKIEPGLSTVYFENPKQVFIEDIGSEIYKYYVKKGIIVYSPFASDLLSRHEEEYLLK